jgi:hypothetical protein
MVFKIISLNKHSYGLNTEKITTPKITLPISTQSKIFLNWLNQNKHHLKNKCFAINLYLVLALKELQKAPPTINEIETLQTTHRNDYRLHNKKKYLSPITEEALGFSLRNTSSIPFTTIQNALKAFQKSAGFHLDYDKTFIISLSNKKLFHVFTYMRYTTKEADIKTPNYITFDNNDKLRHSESLKEVFNKTIKPYIDESNDNYIQIINVFKR